MADTASEKPAHDDDGRAVGGRSSREEPVAENGEEWDTAFGAGDRESLKGLVADREGIEIGPTSAMSMTGSVTEYGATEAGVSAAAQDVFIIERPDEVGYLPSSIEGVSTDATAPAQDPFLTERPGDVGYLPSSVEGASNDAFESPSEWEPDFLEG